MIKRLPGIYASRVGLDEALEKPDDATWVVLTRRKLRTLPRELLACRRVRVIEADNCGLEELPDWLADLPQLRHIKADQNKLTSLPRAIGKAKKLQWIGLTQNQLTSLPEEIGDLTDL